MNGKWVRWTKIVAAGVLCAVTGGIFNAAVAVRHTITSLPYTASTNNDTLDLAGTKVSSSGNGISVTASNVVINLGSDTLLFAGSYGINVNNTSSVKVLGGTVLRTSATGSCEAISIHNSNNLLFSATDVTVNGHNAHCVSIDGGYTNSYNIEFSGGRWTSNSVSYTSRESYDGSVAIMGSMPATSGNFDVSIHGVTIVNGPGQGIVLRGSSLLYDCNINLDAYNKYWDTVYSWNQAPIGASWANPYAVLARGLEAGAKIYNNNFTSGTQRYGCRGMLFELCSGTRTKPIEIYNNYVNIKEGPNKEEGNDEGICQVIRIRGEADSNLYIHDNTFIGTADNSTATTATGAEVRTFYYNSSGTPNSNVIVRNNLIRAATTSSGTNCYALVLEGSGDPSVIFQYNRIESAGDIIKFGGIQGACKSFVIEKDTLSFLSTSLNTRTTYTVGYYNSPSTDNRVRDCAFLLGARDTNIVFQNSSADNSIKLERTIAVTVRGNNGLPVRDATVRISNNYGKVVTNSITGTQGLVENAVSYWYESEDQPDSLNFNPMKITVKKGNDSTVSTMTLSATGAVAPLLSLAATAGQAISGNSAPSAPVPVSPINGASVTGSPVRLVVLNSVDLNNDPVKYDFWISSNSSFTQIVDSQKNIPAGYLQTQATFANFAPVIGTTYWWRSRASDGIDWSSTSTPLAFTYQCSNSATIADITKLVSYLFNRGTRPARTDYNGNGASNIQDLVYLVSFLFAGGPAPSCS